MCMMQPLDVVRHGLHFKHFKRLLKTALFRYYGASWLVYAIMHLSSCRYSDNNCTIHSNGRYKKRFFFNYFPSELIDNTIFCNAWNKKCITHCIVMSWKWNRKKCITKAAKPEVLIILVMRVKRVALNWINELNWRLCKAPYVTYARCLLVQMFLLGHPARYKPPSIVCKRY